jgi:hypothetical protein
MRVTSTASYDALLNAAHVRFGRVKEEQGRFRIPCVFHGGSNRNLVVFESGAAKCWSKCGRNFSPTEVAKALGVGS